MLIVFAPQPSKKDSADTELRNTPSQKESTSDIDYFEKFTLLDEVVPGEQAPKLQEEVEQPAAKPQAEEQKPAKETATGSPSASEDSFVFVTDVEIVGEHLDEVFYGDGAPTDTLRQREDDEAEDGAGMRTRRESQRSTKENGTVLFGSEETILTPIFISPGPPKIIDPILLEEPTAMSFMYSDLYEDAVGERRKSDGGHSEAESLASEKSFKRSLSESEEADGYLEKFILKDETPTVEVQPDSAEDETEGRMMWSKSKFEMTGCLARVAQEEDKDKTKTEEPKAQEGSTEEMSEDLQEKWEIVTETENEREEKQLSTATEEQAVGQTSEESIQESKLMEEKMQDQEVKHEVKREQTEPPESRTDELPPETQQVDKETEKTEDIDKHQRGEPAEKVSERSIIESNLSCQTQKQTEKTAEVLEEVTEEAAVKAPVSTEVPQMVIQSEIQTETTEKSLSEEAATDTEMAATDVKEITAAETETPAEVKELETVRQEILNSAEPAVEIEASAETSMCEEKEAVAPEKAAPVEVITDCEPTVHAVVKVTEKTEDEKEIQTKVQIDLQEVTRQEALIEKMVAESPYFVPEADQQSEVKTEISSEVAEPLMPDKVMTGSGKKQHEILETDQRQQDKSAAGSETEKTKLTAEATDAVQNLVDVGDELLLLVPKGKAVEMDIEIGQWPEKITKSALSEPDNTCEHLIVSENTTICSEALQAAMEETITEPQLEKEPQVALKLDALLRNELDRSYSPAAPVEEADTEEQKTGRDLEEDEGVFSLLRSFTPREDLSDLHREDVQSEAAEVEQKTEIQKVEDAPEINIMTKYVSPEIDLHTDDVGQKIMLDEAAAEGPEVTAEEPEYEMISKQDAREITKSEIQRDAEELRPESGQEREERMEMKVETEQNVLDLSADEELIEDDYEIIDAEEESQARLAAELQGMDWFCLTCECLLSKDDCECGEHRSHQVTAVDKAYEGIKVMYYVDVHMMCEYKAYTTFVLELDLC